MSTTTIPTTPPAIAQAIAQAVPDQLAEHLRLLGLTSLARELPALLTAAYEAHPAYEGFLEQALELERHGRAQRAYERRLRAAHLPTVKLLDTFDFSFQPTLSERQCRDLASLSFVQTATNVIFVGPPGVGKTHLALALANLALQTGYSARFTTLRELAEELETVTWRQQRRRYLTPRLLLIDEVGYLRLTPNQAHALFDLVTARYEQGAILLTSNRSFTEWGTLLGDEVLATALLDRLLHHAEVIAINGRSYRMKDRLLPDTASGGAQAARNAAS